MPASPGNDQLGARPSRAATPAGHAEWQARTFTDLAPYAPPPPGDISLDDEVADDPADDPDATRAHIAALRSAGLL